jgi:hypothetical protein
MFAPLFPHLRDSDNQGRCMGMTVPQGDDDLLMHRCVRVGEWQRAGRLVCDAHSHTLAIRFCDQPNI